MVKSKGDPLFMADTQKLLAEYAANQDRSDEFERALDDLVRDNPNPKTSSAQ